MTTYNSAINTTRWTDSIERAVMAEVLSRGESVSFKDTANAIFKTLKKMAAAIGTKMIDMSEQIYEERQEQIRAYGQECRLYC